MTDINETLKQRGQRYGTFAENAATAQSLKNVLRSSDNWVRLDHDMQQALDVICDKASRILSGDPTYADNWHDIAGYAKLVEDRLTAPVAPTGFAPEPEYVADNAPLKQPALSQDDDPKWEPWCAASLGSHEFVVRRYDAEDNYQDFAPNGIRRHYETAKTASEMAYQLNTAPLERPALSQDDDPKWGPWGAYVLAAGWWTVRRYDAEGNYQDFAPNGIRRHYKDSTPAIEMAYQLNKANKA